MFVQVPNGTKLQLRLTAQGTPADVFVYGREVAPGRSVWLKVEMPMPGGGPKTVDLPPLAAGTHMLSWDALVTAGKKWLLIVEVLQGGELIARMAGQPGSDGKFNNPFGDFDIEVAS